MAVTCTVGEGAQEVLKGGEKDGVVGGDGTGFLEGLDGLDNVAADGGEELRQGGGG